MTIIVTFEPGVLASDSNEKRWDTITYQTPEASDIRAWLSSVGIADRVTKVAATGDSLSHIVANFPNLPYRDYAENPFVVWTVWYGDMAKFIAGNL
jgi:hypothetical protein